MGWCTCGLGGRFSSGTPGEAIDRLAGRGGARSANVVVPWIAHDEPRARAVRATEYLRPAADGGVELGDARCRRGIESFPLFDRHHYFYGILTMAPRRPGYRMNRNGKKHFGLWLPRATSLWNSNAFDRACSPGPTAKWPEAPCWAGHQPKVSTQWRDFPRAGRHGFIYTSRLELDIRWTVTSNRVRPWRGPPQKL